MKKGLFLFAGVAAMLMLAGCGGGGSASTDGSGNDVNPKVSEEEAQVTTPKNLYNITDELGTPPALPAQ